MSRFNPYSTSPDSFKKEELGSQSGSEDGTSYPIYRNDIDTEEESGTALISQTLNADGTPKRPMNAFMIFARRRRPQVSSENQSMRTGEVSKILSKEWSNMPSTEKQFYLDQAKQLKETFNSRYPDYVYRRRPNNSRKRRRSDAPGGPMDGNSLSPERADDLIGSGGGGSPTDVDDTQSDPSSSENYPRFPHDTSHHPYNHEPSSYRPSSSGNSYPYPAPVDYHRNGIDRGGFLSGSASAERLSSHGMHSSRHPQPYPQSYMSSSQQQQVSGSGSFSNGTSDIKPGWLGERPSQKQTFTGPSAWPSSTQSQSYGGYGGQFTYPATATTNPAAYASSNSSQFGLPSGGGGGSGRGFDEASRSYSPLDSPTGFPTTSVREGSLFHQPGNRDTVPRSLPSLQALSNYVPSPSPSNNISQMLWPAGRADKIDTSP